MVVSFLALPEPDDAKSPAGGGGSRGDLFSLDTLVTVVDSTSFLEEVRNADDLVDRGVEAEEEDTRTVADLLISQASAPSSVTSSTRRRTVRKLGGRK